MGLFDVAAVVVMGGGGVGLGWLQLQVVLESLYYVSTAGLVWDDVGQQSQTSFPFLLVMFSFSFDVQYFRTCTVLFCLPVGVGARCLGDGEDREIDKAGCEQGEKMGLFIVVAVVGKGGERA